MSISKLLSLDGKVAVVTGGSRGLGKAISIKFAQAGCRAIAINSQSGREENFAEVRNALSEYDVQLYCAQGDVGKTTDVKRFFSEVIEKFGKIDILVNNAGACASEALLDTTEAIYDTVLDVNLKGTFFCMQEAIRSMLAAKEGTIINISSTAGITGGSVGPHYGASKAGVIALTQSAGRYYAKLGICINAIAPGDMDTDMLNDLFDEEYKKNERIKKIPLGRIANAEEIANVALFLASDMSNYIIGETIRVSGGRI